MQNLNHHLVNDCSALDRAAQLLNVPAGASERQAQRAGSAAGAGLVTSKTKANESNKTSSQLVAKKATDTVKGGHFDITFTKALASQNRVDRLKRSVWASGHLHGLAKKGHRPLQPWFVTLTYKGVKDWRPNHVKKAMNAYRAWCERKGYATKYTWVSELQARGAVHYHLLIWLPVGAKMPHWDREQPTPSGRLRAPFWPHGMTNTQIAKSGVGYLMKYLSKLGELTVFPEGLRLYGIGGLDPLARCVRAWYNLPEWAKCLYGVGDLKRWNNRLMCVATGELLEPMYAKQLIPGGIRLTLLRDYPERWHSGAYSTVPR